MIDGYRSETKHRSSRSGVRMGSSASKSLPLKLTKLKVQAEAILPTARRMNPSASEIKPAAASDGEDAGYLRNLSALGAVSVPKTPNLFRPDARMLDILKRRQEAAEEEDQIAISPKTNRISAQALSNLFDERKSAKSRAEVEVLAKEYGIELHVLEELAKHVTAPSVSSIKSAEDDKQDTQLARWIDAPDSIAQNQIAAK